MKGKVGLWWRVVSWWQGGAQWLRIAHLKEAKKKGGGGRREGERRQRDRKREQRVLGMESQDLLQEHTPTNFPSFHYLLIQPQVDD